MYIGSLISTTKAWVFDSLYSEYILIQFPNIGINFISTLLEGKYNYPNIGSVIFFYCRVLVQAEDPVQFHNSDIGKAKSASLDLELAILDLWFPILTNIGKVPFTHVPIFFPILDP